MSYTIIELRKRKDEHSRSAGHGRHFCLQRKKGYPWVAPVILFLFCTAADIVHYKCCTAASDTETKIHLDLTNKPVRDPKSDIKDFQHLQASQNILVPNKYIDRPSEQGTLARDNATISFTLRHGEYLAQILRDRCCMPSDQIFLPGTKEKITAVNPHLTDINFLQEGQVLQIPRTLCACAQDTKASAEGERRSFGQGRVIEETDRAGVLRAESKLERETDIVSHKNTSDISRGEFMVRSLLSGYVRAFRGNDNNTGTTVFSTGDRGEMVLDRSMFPIYELPWRRRIILDYEHRLPRDLSDVIKGSWHNAEIVSVDRTENMNAILGKVLGASGFSRVERNGTYAIGRNNVQISVGGDWIVFKDSELRSIFVVNLVGDDDSELPDSLKRYFEEKGLSIIDIRIGSQGEGAERPTSGFHHQVTLSETIQLVDTVLALAGIEYQQAYRTNIIGELQEGFAHEIVVSRMFEKDHETYVIDFQGQPPTLQSILREQGIRCLQIDPNDTNKEELIRRIFDFCGLTYTQPPVKFAYDRTGTSGIVLTVYGYLLETPNGEVLFTDSDIDRNIQSFLSEIDVRVIRF